MRTRFTNSALGFFRTLAAARRAELALESNRNPKAADLTALGIDPARFSEIRR